MVPAGCFRHLPAGGAEETHVDGSTAAATLTSSPSPGVVAAAVAGPGAESREDLILTRLAQRKGLPAVVATYHGSRALHLHNTVIHSTTHSRYMYTCSVRSAVGHW